MKENSWSEEQIALLKNNYSNLFLSKEEICKLINKSWVSIQAKAHILKIKRGFTSYKHIELNKYKEDIIEKYNKGISTEKLGKQYNVSGPTMLSFLIKNNINTSKINSITKKSTNIFKLNENREFEKINNITPIKFSQIKKDGYGKSYWFFECHCGNVFESCASDVRRKKVQSCGCLKIRKKKDNVNWKGFESISGSMFYHYKRNAKLRNLEFSITKEYLWQIYLQQNKKCVYTGFDLDLEKKENSRNRTPSNASLDRIDSNKGYIEGNVQWVFKIINMMKWDLSHETFINYCKIITKNTFNEQ